MIKIGVPHLVVVLDYDITKDINEIGDKINNEILSNPVNINFVNKNNFRIRT